MASKKKLMTVANYATKIKATPTWVYRLIKNKKVKVVKIDGIQFIEV